MERGKRVFTAIILVCFSLVSSAQLPDEAVEKEIRSIMAGQEKCWNSFDIDCFMESYWKSDSLRFIGKEGIIYGWQSTLERYKKTYSSQAQMGKLSFELLSFEDLGNAVMVIGKWKLERAQDPIGGIFSLIWKQIAGKWVIVSDHTS